MISDGTDDALPWDCHFCRSVGAHVKTAESSALAHLVLEFLDADKLINYSPSVRFSQAATSFATFSSAPT
jgi:hypothetical protein